MNQTIEKAIIKYIGENEKKHGTCILMGYCSVIELQSMTALTILLLKLCMVAKHVSQSN